MSKSKQTIDSIRNGIVPAGYERTKAGIIPADWEIHPLSQHLSESRIPGSNGSIAKKLSVKLWNKGVCEKHEVHSGSESTKYYKRKKGQFIYSKLDFLNCAFGIIPEELDGYESTIDLPCFDLSDVNDYYFLSYITQPKFYSHYGMLADGGRKARRVDPEEMLSFPLVFPPLPEQQKIAEILATQDKVIELKEKLLEQKQTQKKWLMQKLLSNDGTTFMLGGVKIDKSGWKKEKLGNICNTFSGGTPNRSNAEYFNGNIPWIKSGELNNGNIYSTEENLTELGLKNSSAKIVEKGTLLIAMYGATAGVLATSYICAAINQAVLALVPKIEIEKFYLRNAILNQIETYINKFTQGGQPNFNASIIGNFIVYLPSLPEQQAIAEVLSTADKEIDLLKSDIEQEKQKKKALMQLLLTGIVRVKV